MQKPRVHHKAKGDALSSSFLDHIKYLDKVLLSLLETLDSELGAVGLVCSHGPVLQGVDPLLVCHLPQQTTRKKAGKQRDQLQYTRHVPATSLINNKGGWRTKGRNRVRMVTSKDPVGPVTITMVSVPRETPGTNTCIAKKKKCGCDVSSEGVAVPSARLLLLTRILLARLLEPNDVFVCCHLSPFRHHAKERRDKHTTH